MAFITPSLFDPDLKQQWAHHHLGLLKKEIQLFSVQNPAVIEPEEDTEAGEYIVKIYQPNLVNALVAVLTFGDFVNNLRASLDYLIWQLVIQNGQSPTVNNSFPIIEEDNHHGRRALIRACTGVSAKVLPIIESFQPYRSGTNNGSSHLWRLATLCNIQKHRQISPFAAQPPWQFSISSDSEPKGWSFRTERIDNCSVMAFPLAAKDHIVLNPAGTICELRFIDSETGINLGYEDLREMYSFVADEVMPAFFAFFPEPDVPWRP